MRPARSPAPYIAVVGGGAADHAAEDAAELIGRGLAGAGAVLVCGGLGGVMAAACRGAHRGGGVTVGILPGPERSAANPWVSVAIATGLGELRNGLVARAADVVIAVGGGWGTLSEIALARRLGTPVVGLGTWRLEPPRAIGTGIVVVESAEDAVERALAAAVGRRRGP